MKGLMLTGGHGTRLRPLTFSGNKHMLPIANKPMLLWGLEHLRAAGIIEVGVILGPIAEGVQNLLQDGRPFGLKITYIEQKEPLGIAHAILMAQEFLDKDDFVLYLGDNLLQQSLIRPLKVFESSKCDCLILTTEVKDPQRFGVLEVRNGRVIRLVEKPKDPPSNLVLIGVCILNHTIFEAIRTLKPSWRNELEITEAIQYLIDSGRRVEVVHVKGWWKDAGKPEDLLEANRLVLSDLEPYVEGTIEEGAEVSGKVSIGQGTIIRKGCKLSGPIIIGRNCDIGTETYIGPYTSIGDDTRLKNSEIENSIVMEGAYIDCGKRIVDSIIGRNARVTDFNSHLPRGHKLILGDMTFVSI